MKSDTIGIGDTYKMRGVNPHLEVTKFFDDLIQFSYKNGDKSILVSDSQLSAMEDHGIIELIYKG